MRDKESIETHFYPTSEEELPQKKREFFKFISTEVCVQKGEIIEIDPHLLMFILQIETERVESNLIRFSVGNLTLEEFGNGHRFCFTPFNSRAEKGKAKKRKVQKGFKDVNKRMSIKASSKTYKKTPYSIESSTVSLCHCGCEELKDEGLKGYKCLQFYLSSSGQRNESKCFFKLIVHNDHSWRLQETPSIDSALLCRETEIGREEEEIIEEEEEKGSLQEDNSINCSNSIVYCSSSPKSPSTCKLGWEDPPDAREVNEWIDNVFLSSKKCKDHGAVIVSFVRSLLIRL
jgi:hypothetical protein